MNKISTLFKPFNSINSFLCSEVIFMLEFFKNVCIQILSEDIPCSMSCEVMQLMFQYFLMNSRKRSRNFILVKTQTIPKSIFLPNFCFKYLFLRRNFLSSFCFFLSLLKSQVTTRSSQAVVFYHHFSLWILDSRKGFFFTLEDLFLVVNRKLRLNDRWSPPRPMPCVPCRSFTF